MKSKKDIILVIITVILVIVLIVGFIYDRNSALLDRTNKLAISSDENLEVVSMNKVGFLYMRAAYEAKVRIKDGRADNYIIKIATLYGGAGEMFDINGYKQYEADALNSVTIKPNPREDSFIWVLGTPVNDKTAETVVYIVTQEGNGDSYIYLYYSRK